MENVPNHFLSIGIDLLHDGVGAMVFICRDRVQTAGGEASVEAVVVKRSRHSLALVRVKVRKPPHVQTILNVFGFPAAAAERGEGNLSDCGHRDLFSRDRFSQPRPSSGSVRQPTRDAFHHRSLTETQLYGKVSARRSQFRTNWTVVGTKFPV